MVQRLHPAGSNKPPQEADEIACAVENLHAAWFAARTAVEAMRAAPRRIAKRAAST